MKLTLSNWEKRWGALYLLLQMFLVPWCAAVLCIALGVRSATAVNLVGFFANAGLSLLFFREVLMQSVRNSLSGIRKTLGTAALGFVIYWLLSEAVMMLILALKPDFANINDMSVNAMIDEFPVLMPIAVVFAAPLAEECLFRGWLFTGLAERSLPLAYGATTLFFASIHIFSYLGTYDALTLGLCTMQYLVPGAVLCWTCRKANSLLAPLLLHMTINTIALFTTR